MRFRRAVGVVAILAGTVGSLVGAAPAVASGVVLQPSVQSVKPYVTVSPANPNVAYVQATYTCYGGTAANHLWVSVKQGPGDLTQEGSSQIATAWYDAHPTNHVCNGRPNTTVFAIHRHLDKAQLAAGSGYLQFCLIPNNGIAIKNLNVTVLRPGG